MVREKYPRVIIVAENASARFGGEAILPLHYFSFLRNRGVEVWLVVHKRVKSELDELCKADISRIIYVPDLWVHKWLWRLSKKLPSRIGENTCGLLMHFITQVMQRRIVKKMVKELAIDVVHEPAPVSPKAPSLMFGVGAPVIIGPMNGGMSYPVGFKSYSGVIERSFIHLGRFFSNFINLLIPGKLLAFHLLVANERTRNSLPKWSSKNISTLVENGVDRSLFTPHQKNTLKSSSVVKLVFLGRLVKLKGIDILLQSMASALCSVTVELHIVGDGDQRQSLEHLAQDLGIDSQMTFYGFVPQAQCPSILEKMDVLILPSLHECGGAVVLEAMALGLPVIATDWGGPADYVTKETGMLVDPTGGREMFTSRLKEAIVEMVENPRMRKQMGVNGKERVAEVFDWNKKIDQMLYFYDQSIK